MKFIPLTQGQFTLVDDDVYEELGKFKWYASREGRDLYYAHRRDQSQGGKLLLMHRVITGAKPGQIVDHRDGNPLNNLRSNLRICTQAENGKNIRLRINNTSGLKGVSWQKNRRYYQASLRINGKMTCAGCYENPIHAAMAYNEAALKYHGELARINVLSAEQVEQAGPPKRIRPGDRLRSDNKSGFLGVSWFGAQRLWSATVSIAGYPHYFGRYPTKEEAAYSATKRHSNSSATPPKSTSSARSTTPLSPYDHRHRTVRPPHPLTRGPQAVVDLVEPDEIGDVVADLNLKPGQAHADIYVAGDSQYLHTMSKRAYRRFTLWPTITHLIQYLDDHGLHQDPKTGLTHLDGIPADDLCAFLWDRVKAHLEYGDTTTLPDFIDLPVETVQ